MASTTDQLSFMAKFGIYFILGFFALLAMLPFCYMVMLSLQSDADQFAGKLIPETLMFSNYVTIWEKAPFARFILNSFIIAGCITVLHVIFDPMLGYVFAKMEFPGKRFMFVCLLATLMIPFIIRLIPLYILTAQMGLLNSYTGLIMPFAMSAFGIFFMRQFIQPIPDDLIASARLDNASELRIFIDIVLPQLKPAIATLGLLTFVFQFNEFIWPLTVVSSEQMRPITTGLTLFNQEYFTQWNLTAVGGMLLFLPCFLLFIFAQRFFVQSVMMSGMK